ncbi:dehydratase [Rhodococcus sp. ABRD24]|uniref:MaoC/PaaZ C-terminal domain-containing protein n=1 Tax=Rhodococcus sp. ABRD24 TaxID=2507582 RepID=UPI00103A7D0C|nr:MaoC/PaaZ C-terminal domain-containing protein [Rhodococcus sp. ABRD24]QBJ96474.1 dehydratase [Rhodococcus sp. ABRD24]
MTSSGTRAHDRTHTLHAEQLQPGRSYELGTHLVTTDELIDFASKWDPQWFHVDAEAADHGPFGGLIASGLHTVSIFQKLAVAAVIGEWNVIAGRALRDVRFLRPVRPGDELTGAITIENVQFETEKERALVTTSAQVRNVHGAEVLTAVMDAYVGCRPTAVTGR